MVVITRADLSPGYQLVQSCHTVADFCMRRPRDSESWHKSSNSIITLSVSDEHQLEMLSKKMQDKLSVPVVEFREPDIQHELTSISFIACDDVRKKLSHLPLALKKLGQGIDKHTTKSKTQPKTSKHDLD